MHQKVAKNIKRFEVAAIYFQELFVKVLCFIDDASNLSAKLHQLAHIWVVLLKLPPILKMQVHRFLYRLLEGDVKVLKVYDLLDVDILVLVIFYHLLLYLILQPIDAELFLKADPLLLSN